MRIINSGIIHTFMFGMFPILFIFTNNLSEISLHSLLIPIIIIFSVISVLTLILIKISKNIQKATLTVSFLLLLFFSIGYVRIWLHGFEVFGFALDQVKFLIFVYFIIFVAGLFSIYKIKEWSKPTQIISVISIVVIISFLPSIVFDMIGIDNKSDFSTQIKFEKVERPNIYFIILDGYAGGESLKRDFNFDNSEFIDYLKNLGFIVTEKSFSNYGSTELSTISALNMDYLHNQQGFSSKNIMLKKHLFSNNLVMKTLQDNGYTTMFIDGGAGLRDIKVSNKILCHSTDNSLLQALIDTSMMNYIAQGFFWDSWLKIRNCAFTELETIQENTNAPFFVYAHIRTPHDPYSVDQYGNFVQYAERADQLDKKTNDERYIYQLKYTNKKVMEIISKILSVEPKPIIILVSDHGWEQFASSPPTDEEFLQWHSNFQSFYLPDVDNYELYHKITLVNIFRVVFNDYFGTNLEILDDKAYYVNLKSDKDYLDQREITEIMSSQNKKEHNN